MPDETLDYAESESVIDEGISVGDVSDSVLSESAVSDENTMESAQNNDGSYTVDFPSDYLDKQTFNDGVDEILTALEETEEVVYVNSQHSTFALGSVELPYDAVTFECEGKEIVFPSGYADDVSVVDGMLVNLGANYTFGVEFDIAPVSNYIASEVTVPTYHSSTWYQYLATYGQPYRVVDRYISNYGSLSSSTRESVDLEFSGGNDWAGYGTSVIIGGIILWLLLMREVRTWLT